MGHPPPQKKTHTHTINSTPLLARFYMKKGLCTGGEWGGVYKQWLKTRTSSQPLATVQRSTVKNL